MHDIVISCLCAALTHTLCYFCPLLFSHAVQHRTQVHHSGGGWMRFVVSSLLAIKVSQSGRWHARSHFYHYHAPYSLTYFLLYSSSCLFQHRRLDHSNIIEGEGAGIHWVLYRFGHEQVRWTCNLFLGDSIFFSLKFFFHWFSFRLTFGRSAGS